MKKSIKKIIFIIGCFFLISSGLSAFYYAEDGQHSSGGGKEKPSESSPSSESESQTNDNTGGKSENQGNGNGGTNTNPDGGQSNTGGTSGGGGNEKDKDGADEEKKKEEEEAARRAREEAERKAREEREHMEAIKNALQEAEEKANDEEKRLQELEAEIAKAEERLKNADDGNMYPAASRAMQQTMDSLKRQQEEKRKKYDEIQKECEKLNKEIKEKENSKTGGDPVRLTTGSYEQNESDIIISGVQPFEVKRKYDSENKIISSFGYGWVTNLDQRIILGTSASIQNEYEELLVNLSQAKEIMDSLEVDIKSSYRISSIENGETEILQRKNRLLEIGAAAHELALQRGENIEINIPVFETETETDETSETQSSDGTVSVSPVSGSASGSDSGKVSSSGSDLNSDSGSNSTSGSASTSSSSSVVSSSSSSSSSSSTSSQSGSSMTGNPENSPGSSTGFSGFSEGVTSASSDGNQSVPEIEPLPNILEGVITEEELNALIERLRQKSENLSVTAEQISAEAYRRAEELDGIIESFREDVSVLNQIQSEYEAMKHEVDAFYAAEFAPSAGRHNRNSRALFTGMESGYEETGLDTITLIDENGYPHLLYETGEGSRIWRNDSEKNIVNVTVADDGYLVSLRDGTVKAFDEAGFIIRLTDRNGNTIGISRNPDEKINYIETSFGEKYRFEYNGRFISKITNERSLDESVSYGYSGNSLVSVKDTDGDTVTMTYDSEGRMTALNKCDGSSVRFEYGEQTADGFVLTTATVNEEGYAEHFEYDRSGMRTVYIDHDGNRTFYWYDGRHRTVREEQPDGTVIINEYDDFDNLIRVNENGDVTSFSYDGSGNKTAASYSDGSYESWIYDNFGLVISYTDRDGVREEYIRDGKGNITAYRRGGKTVYAQTVNASGQVTSRIVYGENAITVNYVYDRYGNVLCKECGGVLTEYLYDSRNRLVKEKLARKVLSEYQYDGNRIVRKDYNGLETIYLTNGRKDLVKVTQKDTVTGIVHETRIEYDRRHLPLRVFEGNGENEKLVSSYLYTAEGKLRAEILHGSESWIRLYEYRNNQICEVKQFKVSIGGLEQANSVGAQGNRFEAVGTNSSPIDENRLRTLLTEAGENVFVQEYGYQISGGNRKLVTVTDGLGIQSLFEYDSYGNLVKVTDGNAEVRQKNYTRAGRVSSEQSSHGGWYEYGYTDGSLSSAREQGGAAIRAEYYPDGSLKSETDRYGKTTYYHYDSRSRVVSVQSEAQKIWYEYDDFDRVVKTVVGNSADEAVSVYYETHEYSSDGRKVTVSEGGKYKTVYELDAFGNVVKQIDGNTNERSYVYDIHNSLIAEYDGYGEKTSYEYNALGLVSRVTLPDETETKYEYNYMGLLSKVTDDCGIVYEVSYDNAGRLTKERNRADSEKSYEYDRAGRVTKVLCGGEVVESYTYGTDNRTITVKDGNGNDYLYNYDSFGRMTSERNRSSLEQNYFYDEEGQLKLRNSFDGGTTTISYSSDRTVRTVRYSDGSENRFVYDMIGNITESQNAYGRTQYRYDQGSRMIYQKDVTTGEEIYFTYDDAGNRIRLESSNRQTSYTYGKNNEVKEIFDNKQRISIKLEYDKVGREALRKFGNGTSEQTLYDKAGRVTVKTQKNSRGELLWGEGYVYGSDGKRTATVDNLGRITFYEYNNKGQLSTVYYPYTEEMIRNLKSESETNGLATTVEAGENRFITSTERAELVPLMNSMQYGLAYNLTNLQVFIKESYSYDKNGNCTSKTTLYGKIEYSYDRENCLLSSGSKGQTFINYTYDAMGNLLTEESANKTVKYAYNAQNRLIYCEVIDKTKKEYAQTTYAYDAFGRRVLVQDKNEAAIRTFYDGLTFDIIKQGPTFANGQFTDSGSGIKFSSTGRPTGDRYRYLGDEDKKDGTRYFYLDEGTYKNVSSRYRGERTTINVNGTLAAQTTTEGTDYFSTDLLGSIRSTTDVYGAQKSNYTYDAFGSLVQGDITGTTDFGYLGKQHDPTSHLYNYGYRDYKPQTARFTTLDPICDGNNWFSYCNCDPINFIDLWGLEIQGRTSEFKMSDTDWGDLPTGYGTEHKKNKDVGMLKDTGCAITEMSNIISSATGKTITPKDINDDKNNFTINTDLLNMKDLGEKYNLEFDYWTKDKQGNLGKKLSELSQSSKKYYIAAQVRYKENGALHWVGIVDIIIDKDGKIYAKIAPTSTNDTKKSARKLDSWKLDENGDMWIETSEINKIYTFEKTK